MQCKLLTLTYFGCLSLSQSSPRCVHSIVLATLLELCDNPNTLSHILSWRDDVGQTAPRLLLQLWRQEEEDLGVSRNHHGGITGLQLETTRTQQLQECDDLDLDLDLLFLVVTVNQSISHHHR